jgi:hypothetical protein
MDFLTKLFNYIVVVGVLIAIEKRGTAVHSFNGWEKIVVSAEGHVC